MHTYVILLPDYAPIVIDRTEVIHQTVFEKQLRDFLILELNAFDIQDFELNDEDLRFTAVFDDWDEELEGKIIKSNHYLCTQK